MNAPAYISNPQVIDLPLSRKSESILPLRLDEVSFAAGQQTLLNAVSLSFEAGTRSIILGPNGAGKSLLLRLCHGLIQPSSGSVRWAVSAGDRLHRAQAMVFQRPVLLRRSTIANITYALAAHGISWRERKAVARAALDEVGLTHLARRPARVLSGGEQQRLALARAWALRPQVLFLDEPSASLDPGATRLIEDIIRAIHRNGTTLIMTTHDIGQARRLAERIVFLHRGRLLEQRSADDFFKRAQSRQAQAFLAGELLD